MTRKTLKTRSMNLGPRQFLRDERGLSTVEYIIILVLIAVAGISLWQAFGDVLGEKISGATSEVQGM